MTTLNIRVDEKLKTAARKVLAKQGLDMSVAVKIFLNQVVIEKGIPFRITHNPLVLKQKWDREVKETLEKGKEHTSASDLLEDVTL